MDAAARRSLAAAVRSLTDGGSAVVLATHDTELAAELADRTISLRDGRAVEVVAAAAASPAAAMPGSSR
jgi:energy-coupling factor transport system ATP-binding protein